MTITVILHEPESVDEKYLTIWSRADAERCPGNPDGSGHLAISPATRLAAEVGDGEPTWEDTAWQ